MSLGSGISNIVSGILYETIDDFFQDLDLRGEKLVFAIHINIIDGRMKRKNVTNLFFNFS